MSQTPSTFGGSVRTLKLAPQALHTRRVERRRITISSAISKFTTFTSATEVSGNIDVIATWKENISYATATTSPNPLELLPFDVLGAGQTIVPPAEEDNPSAPVPPDEPNNVPSLISS